MRLCPLSVGGFADSHEMIAVTSGSLYGEEVGMVLY